MVAFGKKLRESQIQEWKGYYINYKFMKKKVKRYVEQIEVGAQNHHNVLRDFSLLLDNQIEKIVLFLLEQQGVLARRLSHIGQDHQNLLQQPDSSKISELQEANREVGRDLLRLLHFVEMNATGLRKILKKFDKRFGYKFTDYYVKTRANHPYSQLRQVLRHVGIGAVVGVLSHNLADLNDLQKCQGSYISIYDQPSYAHQDPILESIKVAADRLSNSTNFLQFLGRHAFIMQPEEISPSPSEENIVDERYHFMSLLLNLASTFLYMVNTYIVVPTADNYSLNLGAAASVCGVVIGSMAVAQVFASVYFSAWSNRSYLRPLIFSTIVLMIGNIMYALAYDLNSVAVLLMGRLFCGLGSARAVNRRYISDCVPLKLRMQASAGFVSASALGMACGPAIACLLQTDFRIYKLTMNQDTLPGWVMAIAWLVYLLWLCLCFKEPGNLLAYEAETGQQVHIAVENMHTQPLLMNSEAKEQEKDGEEKDDDEEVNDKIEAQKPVTSIVLAYKLLTPSVKVQLFVYFMLKYAMEIVLAESSLITEYYFIWSTTKVAIFLACLGLTVLPVNIVIGSYISNIFEERQVLLTSEIMVCIGLLLSFHILIPYSVIQYVGSALITFVSAEVLEGVNLSLLSKMMSSRLSRGTYNGGLLSTEAGTLARVIADGTITISGYFSESKLLNTTLLPALLICISSIFATFCTYNSLY
ncbi:putative SPX domain, major facilitator superfamily [Medicago truncatula]|uniref:Putative SPX domain, major facilitator superfamily n=1 Tax=Medicago truncatula TaxID=3880 RepID=G7L2J3_MEDTR|nr:SPX domain-containing membrane protein At4g22990 [Medicago truncatula]XP_024626474.1 SPX domain-containing membrane protein At4g22990 [Medicago truncatula]XP_039683726.1 SPX domain-containing membrane protein At4g22990 [Medicago truncatula]AES80087.1 SPX (SYG1/Pho81/XPR1) domain protein MFS transporter [Medicago truncatula]RHN46876.1 putative SPX domain, major facilitator superfamily [Medicago truncatula]